MQFHGFNLILIFIFKDESVFKMEAPFNLNNYQHGLILYNGTIPKSFNSKLETELLILDHPISEFDQKSSKYKVEWDHQKCDTDQIQDPVIGKTVYHKVSSGMRARIWSSYDYVWVARLEITKLLSNDLIQGHSKLLKGSNNSINPSIIAPS